MLYGPRPRCWGAVSHVELYAQTVWESSGGNIFLDFAAFLPENVWNTLHGRLNSVGDLALDLRLVGLTVFPRNHSRPITPRASFVWHSGSRWGSRMLGPFHTGKFRSKVAVESQLSQETFLCKQSTFERKSLSKVHCVSKKTTMTFYAITSKHINRFW